jgi:selenocysteine-specific elongation factor
LGNFLELLATGTTEEILSARIARRRNAGITLAGLVAETGRTREAIEKWVGDAMRHAKIIRVGEIVVDASAVEGLKVELVRTMEQFHKQNPLVAGIGREQLREQAQVDAAMFDAMLDALVRARKLEVAGELVRLPGHGVVMKDEEAESKKKIEEAFAVAGLKVPALHEVIAGLKVDRVRAQKIVTLLLRDKVLLKISDELVFHATALQELRRLVAGQKKKSPRMDVATFKELTGVSRKYAIPLLEYLDRERVTRRVGDAREIL